MSTTTLIERREALDAPFLARILEPYRPTGTDYLKTVSITHSCLWEDAGDDEPILIATGRYAIPASCYIRNTGHFNAVEFLICYNQLAYVAFGHIVRSGMLHDERLKHASPAAVERFRRLSLEDFLRQQLSSMLILKTETRFKGALSAADFTGTLELHKFFYRSETCFASSFCSFRDEEGGYAEGEILLAYPLGLAT